MPNEVGICNYFGMYVQYSRIFFFFFSRKNGFLTAYIMFTMRCPHKFQVRIKILPYRHLECFKSFYQQNFFLKKVLALRETIQKLNLELSKKKFMFIHNYLYLCICLLVYCNYVYIYYK